CQDNCMSVAAAERIGFEINKNNPAEYFLLADRITKVPIYGRQKARMEMGGYCENIEFAVTEIGDDILLGTSWSGKFRMGQLLIDGPTGQVCIKRKENRPGVMLPIYHKNQDIKMVTSNQIIRSLRNNKGKNQWGSFE